MFEYELASTMQEANKHLSGEDFIKTNYDYILFADKVIQNWNLIYFALVNDMLLLNSLATTN